MTIREVEIIIDNTKTLNEAYAELLNKIVMKKKTKQVEIKRIILDNENSKSIVLYEITEK